MNPFQDGVPEELLDQALVGGLLMTELLHNSRGLVEKPMTIQVVNPKGGLFEEAKLEDLAMEQPK